MGGEIVRTRSVWLWSPLIHLYNGRYRVCIPGIKRPGCGANHPPSHSVEVKESVELYLLTPCVSSWHILGRTLPIAFTDVSDYTVSSQKIILLLTLPLRKILLSSEYPRFCNWVCSRVVVSSYLQYLKKEIIIGSET